MNTIGTFLVLTLTAGSLALPAEEAQCAPLATKEQEIEASKCCKMVGYHEKFQEVLESCMALVKDKPVKGEKTDGPIVLKPEGFDCMGDCIHSKLGQLNNKKLDSEKIMAQANSFYADEWAAVGPTFVKKCLDQASSDEKKECATSGADLFAKCIFRETYLNCPAKSWTDSDICKKNKERIQKCPRALPFRTFSTKEP